MSQPAKRKRFCVTAREKKEICRYKEANSKLTLEALSKHFSQTFGHIIGKSTIGDILMEKSKWLETPDDSGDLTRSRNPKHEMLEKALFLWLGDLTSKHAAVNDEMLIEKAQIFGAELQITDFGYSKGWLCRFKSRHNISRRKYEGESASASQESVVSGRLDLKKFLAQYEPQDIFNIDETGLFF